MLIDQANVELLKLVALCKDVPLDHSFPEVYLLSEANTGRLQSEGMLYISRDGRYYRATQAGYDFLRRCGYDYKPDEYRESGRQVLSRRENSARVMLTLLLAGVDVFTSDVTQLTGEAAYLPSSVIRRAGVKRGRKLAGNTRFTGLGSNGHVFYYVADPQATVAPQDLLYHKYEMNTVNKILAQSRSNSPVVTCPEVVYMGADYHTLVTAMTAPTGDKATYRSAYDKFTMPVYLCPCDPDGAFQMRVMLQPDYRARLIGAMLDAPMPNPFYPGCDGTLDNEPFILAIDMDLRRITDMARTARSVGVKAHIFARQCQCEALRVILPVSGVQFYAISDDDIKSVFSFQSFLTEPPIKPYVTKGGEYVHDETIRVCREARKANQKKGKAP